MFDLKRMWHNAGSAPAREWEPNEAGVTWDEAYEHFFKLLQSKRRKNSEEKMQEDCLWAMYWADETFCKNLTIEQIEDHQKVVFSKEYFEQMRRCWPHKRYPERFWKHEVQWPSVPYRMENGKKKRVWGNRTTVRSHLRGGSDVERRAKDRINQLRYFKKVDKQY